MKILMAILGGLMYKGFIVAIIFPIVAINGVINLFSVVNLLSLRATNCSKYCLRNFCHPNGSFIANRLKKIQLRKSC